jgi:hypothetical protein
MNWSVQSFEDSINTWMMLMLFSWPWCFVSMLYLLVCFAVRRLDGSKLVYCWARR